KTRLARASPAGVVILRPVCALLPVSRAPAPAWRQRGLSAGLVSIAPRPRCTRDMAHNRGGDAATRLVHSVEVPADRSANSALAHGYPVSFQCSFQPRHQCPEAAINARLHCSQWRMRDNGNLVQRKLFMKAEHQRLSVFGLDACQSSKNTLALFKSSYHFERGRLGTDWCWPGRSRV